jgi:hypothetical protein
MTVDPRQSWRYRLRYWNARRGTALLRSVERLVIGRAGSAMTSRPLAIRPPETLHGSIEALRLRHPAEALRFPAPPGLPGWLPRDDAIPAAWCYSFDEPTVAPESGGVWARNGMPIVEVMGGASRYSGSQDVRGLTRRRPRGRLDGTWTVLPNHTYYHFLLEDLPALLSSLAFARDQYGADAGILTPRMRHAYVSDALAGLPHAVHETSERKMAVQRLVASGFHSSHVHPSSLDLLRSHFGITDKPGHRWLYVSRVGFRRSMAYEQALIEYLMSAIPHLEVLQGHAMPLTEQASRFSEAAVIIGTHGAGLANIVFAPATAKIVEIATPANHADHFWRIAAARGMDYGMVWTTPELPETASALAAGVIQSLDVSNQR